MKINTANLNRVLNKLIFQVKHHSPELLMIGGAVTLITGVVGVGKASTKLSGIMDKHNDDVNKICEYLEKHDKSEEYTDDDAKKDVRITCFNTGREIAKLYAVPATLVAVGMGCMIGSNYILKKRTLELAAAFTAVSTSFKQYRTRLKEYFGEDGDKMDRKFRFGEPDVEKKITVTDEDGNGMEVESVVRSKNTNGKNDYARIFDKTNPNWESDPYLTLKFLKDTQNQATKRLQYRGYLFLNDVYNMLGFRGTPEGQEIGWVYDPEGGIGDNKVDFGIYDLDNLGAIDFVNGIDKAVWLDFNFDGVIWQIFPKYARY